MAKQKGPKKASRSESRRFGMLVRIADDVVADARIVASFRGTSMAELISDTLRPLLREMIDQEYRKHAKEGGR